LTVSLEEYPESRTQLPQRGWAAEGINHVDDECINLRILLLAYLRMLYGKKLSKLDASLFKKLE
jgi:hypothetical protein